MCASCSITPLTPICSTTDRTIKLPPCSTGTITYFRRRYVRVSFRFRLIYHYCHRSIRQAQICLIDWHKPTRKYIVFLWLCVVFCGFTKMLKSTCYADIFTWFLVAWYVIDNTLSQFFLCLFRLQLINRGHVDALHIF